MNCFPVTILISFFKNSYFVLHIESSFLLLHFFLPVSIFLAKTLHVLHFVRSFFLHIFRFFFSILFSLIPQNVSFFFSVFNSILQYHYYFLLFLAPICLYFPFHLLIFLSFSILSCCNIFLVFLSFLYIHFIYLFYFYISFFLSRHHFKSELPFLSADKHGVGDALPLISCRSML